MVQLHTNFAQNTFKVIFGSRVKPGPQSPEQKLDLIDRSSESDESSGLAVTTRLRPDRRAQVLGFCFWN